ncbi:MAG: hypothetical protein LBE34_11730 [Flavobacteriaceae bacterium]|nr:hypothetical protein [Flavobacteriaceae bacterium]
MRIYAMIGQCIGGICMFLFVGFPLESWGQKVIQINDLKIESGYYYVKKAFLNGQVRAKYTNGKIAFDWKFEEGRPVNGTWLWYFADGKLKKEIIIEDRGYRTTEKEYYNDGKLSEEFGTLDCELDGVCKTYSVEGVLLKEITYAQGELNGVARNYYRNGMLMMEYYYVKSRAIGWSSIYRADGRLREKTKFTDDYATWEVYYYDETGKEIRTR